MLSNWPSETDLTSHKDCDSYLLRRGTNNLLVRLISHYIILRVVIFLIIVFIKFNNHLPFPLNFNTQAFTEYFFGSLAGLNKISDFWLSENDPIE